MPSPPQASGQTDVLPGKRATGVAPILGAAARSRLEMTLQEALAAEAEGKPDACFAKLREDQAILAGTGR
jgi:hypothetical protein